MKNGRLEKSDLTKELRDKVCFLYFVADYAQGDSGSVTLITNDGQEYWFDYLYGDIKIDDVAEFFPALAQNNPVGWKCERLDLLGHFLLIADEVYDAFFEEIKDKAPRSMFSRVPANWPDAAWKIVRNLNKTTK